MMAEYTFYIPEEFFTGEVTAVQVSIVFIIILVIIVLLAYKIFRAGKKRKRPESF